MEINDKEFYEYYIKENHSMKETLNKFNMKYSYFRKYVVDKKFKKNIVATGIKHKIPSKEEIIQLYIIENKTANELASYYGINYRTFLRWTKKYNIVKTMDKTLENSYNKSIEKYGSKTFFGTKKFKDWRNDNIEIIKEHTKKTCLEKYGVNSFVESSKAKNVWKMGTSKAEQEIFNSIKSIYPDCINGYKSEKYPYNCDFYIPSIDLYIEYQGFYTHGEEPYNENNIEHINKVNELQNKNDNYSNDILYTWTIRDPLKRKTAKDNSLNWIEFFSIEEFNNWFDKINKNNVIKYITSVQNKNNQINICIENINLDVYYPKRKIAFKLRGKIWDNSVGNPKKDTQILMEKGIRLINIYDYEWFNYQESFKEFIKNILKSRNKRMIRSEKVVEISSSEMIEFLKYNHLFVDTIKGCSICYGIYQDNELVAVSGFDKKSRKYNWEWKRFAIKYGWMSKKGIAKLFLDKFSEIHHGLLVDYQQMDRFPFSSDIDMGFIKTAWNSGIVSVNISTMNFTRHGFIPEKGMSKEETMKYYGYNIEVPTAGTITWIKEI